MRATGGFARLGIIYECANCGTRKRHVHGAGRRGGTKVAVREPGEKEYRFRPIPPCYILRDAHR